MHCKSLLPAAQIQRVHAFPVRYNPRQPEEDHWSREGLRLCYNFVRKDFFLRMQPVSTV